MTIQALQPNIHNTKSILPNPQKKVRPYLEANELVQTENRVHPLPPQGHLVKDNLFTSVKYFFKDMVYDAKALKDGISGKANDHQLGRLNDVGLKLGGIGIATYLASQTTNPKVRMMEYIGLGTFLTSMAIYPKIAINEPAKLVHGYDIDKEYIDDQGRKKSVHQDSHYIPYDMYLGNHPEEDIDKIGDRMGIPKDIPNRHEVVKEQMRKIAIQNNTLWMLTAGLATPAMTALICYGLENYVVAPGIEKARNKKYSDLINKLAQKTGNMELDIKSIQENPLSKEISKILGKYEHLPQEEFQHIASIMKKYMDANSASALERDLKNILQKASGRNNQTYFVNDEFITNILEQSKDSIGGKNDESILKTLIPNKTQFKEMLKRINSKADFDKGDILTWEEVNELKAELKKFSQESIANTTDVALKEHLKTQRINFISSITSNIRKNTSLYVSEEAKEKIINCAKILGEFKENQAALDKCLNFKFGFAPETILARYYDKFEKTLLKELKFSSRELQKMRESRSFTAKLLKTKFTELCSDEKRYEQTIKKLEKVILDMDKALHNEESTESILKLMNSIENNFNNTARRLNSLEGFEETINKLVKEDVSTLDLSIKNKETLMQFLDGIRQNPDELIDGFGMTKEKVKLFSKSVGSSKNIAINSMLERYQGSINSFFRVFHLMDFITRTLSPEEFASNIYRQDKNLAKTIMEMGKNVLLDASAADHTQKLHTVNNDIFFRDFMEAVFGAEIGSPTGVNQKGFLSDKTKSAFSTDSVVLKRIQTYITRIKNVIGNNTTDFTKSKHLLNDMLKMYTRESKTNLAIFNLVGQSPVEMVMGAANRKFNTQKWVKIISGITAGVFATALLTQFTFGKIKNKDNLAKQVNNGSNN